MKLVIQNKYETSSGKIVPCPENKYIVKLKTKTVDYNNNTSIVINNVFNLVFNNISSNLNIEDTLFSIVCINYDINGLKLLKQTETKKSLNYILKPVSLQSNYYFIINTNTKEYLKTTTIIENNIPPTIGTKLVYSNLDNIDDSYLFYINSHISNIISPQEYSKCLFGGRLMPNIIYKEKTKLRNNIIKKEDISNNIKLCSTYNNLNLINHNKVKISESKNTNYINCKQESNKNQISSGFTVDYNENSKMYECNLILNMLYTYAESNKKIDGGDLYTNILQLNNNNKIINKINWSNKSSELTNESSKMRKNLNIIKRKTANLSHFSNPAVYQKYNNEFADFKPGELLGLTQDQLTTGYFDINKLIVKCDYNSSKENILDTLDKVMTTNF